MKNSNKVIAALLTTLVLAIFVDNSLLGAAVIVALMIIPNMETIKTKEVKKGSRRNPNKNVYTPKH